MLKEKYFTPELTETERWELFKTLGLDKFRFLFIESVKDSFLRVQENGVGDPVSHLQITTRGTLEAFEKGYLFPVVEVHHLGNREEALAPSPGSFWETLFPYPFSQLGKIFTSGKGVNVRVSPSTLEAELLTLMNSLKALEQKLLGAEVGLLSIRNGFEEFTLVTHSVRGKMIRRGVSEDISAFLSTFRGGAPTPESLEGYFGTSVCYAPLEIVPSPEWAGFQNTAEAFQISVSNTISTIKNPAETTPVIQIQL